MRLHEDEVVYLVDVTVTQTQTRRILGTRDNPELAESLALAWTELDLDEPYDVTTKIVGTEP